MYNHQLETFIRVADAGSFNKAAEESYITPTAIIKQINLLEDSLGVKLFERTRRGLTLTKAGRSMYQDAKYIIQYCHDSVIRARNAMQEDSNVIRIGSSPMTPAQLLMELWSKVQTICPDIKFQIVPFENTPENAREILADLGTNIDVVGGIFDETMLHLRKCAGLELVRRPFYCAVSIHHKLAAKLLKAKVCDVNGNALDLVRYNGVLFKQDSFLEYVLSVLQTKNQLNVWYEDGQDDKGNTKYTQIGKEYVKLENVGDGKVKVVFTNENGASLYTGDGSDYSEQIITTLNDNLATASADATAYNGGLMYYIIPIEHLNNGAITENGIIPEAKYGVVRNHHYVVTVDKLEKIGKGIFDGDEKIVPGDDPDGDIYYVGAKINILSWKIVSQNVEL